MKRKIVIFLLIIHGAICYAGIKKLKFLALQVILKQLPEKVYKMRDSTTTFQDVVRAFFTKEKMDLFSYARLIYALQLKEDMPEVAQTIATDLDVWDKKNDANNIRLCEGCGVDTWVERVDAINQLPDYMKDAVWKARREGKK